MPRLIGAYLQLPVSLIEIARFESRGKLKYPISFNQFPGMKAAKVNDLSYPVKWSMNIKVRL